MKVYKFFWDTHKWVGVISAVLFLNIAITGFLLLIKKEYDWLQPPTQRGDTGTPASFISIEKLFSAVLGVGHEDFKSVEDIDRVDFRPGKRIHKVRSRHNYSEIQVDAVTGEILSVDWRPSDLIESLHDGSLVGGWFHGWIMPAVSIALLFLVGSGVYLWVDPLLRKGRRRRERARRERRSGSDREPRGA